MGVAELKRPRLVMPQEERDAIVRQMWAQRPASQIAVLTGLTKSGVQAAGQRLGMGPSPFARREWTAEEDAILRRDWRALGNAWVAELLSRTFESTRSRAGKLGLAEPRGGLRKAAGISRPRFDDGAVPPRVARDRCPLCEARPNDPSCAHGWDGETTRAMRREAGLRLAAAMLRPVAVVAA